MFKIKPSRVYTFKHEDEEISFSVTFKFPYIEEMKLTRLNELVGDDNSNESSLVLVRESLISCTDIIDEDTNEPIKIGEFREDGTLISINEINQKAVFDNLRRFPELFGKVMAAYIGPKGKNLLSGAMQQSTGNGQ